MGIFVFVLHKNEPALERQIKCKESIPLTNRSKGKCSNDLRKIQSFIVENTNDIIKFA